MSSEQDDQRVMQINSGVSAFTGDPFVQVIWGKEAGQLTTGDAAQHGLAAIMAAVSAELDADIFAEMTDPEGMNLPRENAAAFIMALRQRREKK